MMTVCSKMMDRGVVVTVHHPSLPPTDADYDATIEVLEQAFEGFGRACQIVFTDGQAPNAAQRKRSKERAEKSGAAKVYKSAIITSSSVARGVMTALVWLGLKGLRPFSPGQVDEALAFVGLPASARASLAATAQACLAECSATPLGSMTGL